MQGRKKVMQDSLLEKAGGEIGTAGVGCQLDFTQSTP
jgi:hypothetical protein